jgi:hypothetical protein
MDRNTGGKKYLKTRGIAIPARKSSEVLQAWITSSDEKLI